MKSSHHGAPDRGISGSREGPREEEKLTADKEHAVTAGELATLMTRLQRPRVDSELRISVNFESFRGLDTYPVFCTPGAECQEVFSCPRRITAEYFNLDITQRGVEHDRHREATLLSLADDLVTQAGSMAGYSKWHFAALAVLISNAKASGIT